LPLTIPPFSQYQGVLVPLRGLWHKAPVEGDKLITAEIDWGTSGVAKAVQFSLSGNSPVAISQIVAVAVDNARNGADCLFAFPDSGFQLAVPAHNQLISPVFTNALMFYVSSAAAVASDVTVFQVFNSMPPPIPIQPSSQQNTASVTGVALQTNSTTQVVAAGVTGTLNTISMSLDMTAGATAGAVQLNLNDGTGKVLWVNIYNVPANTTVNYPVELTGLSLRFVNGLQFLVINSTLTSGVGVVNVYYSVP